jgi:hypothetical protein
MWLATAKKPSSAPSDHSTLAGFSKVALYLGAMLLEPDVGQSSEMSVPAPSSANACADQGADTSAIKMPVLRREEIILVSTAS